MNSTVKLVCATLLLLSMVTLIPTMVRQFTASVAEITGAPTSTSAEPAASEPPRPSPAPPTSEAPSTPFEGSPIEGSPLTVDWTVLAIIAVVVLFVVALSFAAFYLWRSVSRHRSAAQEARDRREAQLQRWAKGVKAVTSVSEKLWEFEADPESVYFTRPLLADVTEPASARFYTAYSKVQALQTETVPFDDELIGDFVTAAAEAERAFGAADDNARRKARAGVVSGGRTLTPEQSRKLGLARKLMAQALDSANTSEAAASAHAKATDLLDQVGVVVPERLATAVVRQIEATHRPQLTAGKAGVS